MTVGLKSNHDSFKVAQEEVDYFAESMSYDGYEFNEDKDPCWKGYHMVGMKKKSGREVPNCVPRKKK